MGRARVRVQVISTTLKIVLTAPQPVLVIMSKENAFARKKAQLIPYTVDKGGMIQRGGCLIG
jgi:hypothetical protein